MYVGPRRRLRKFGAYQVSRLIVGGFAVGEILVDHGLKIAEWDMSSRYGI